MDRSYYRDLITLNGWSKTMRITSYVSSMKNMCIALLLSLLFISNIQATAIRLLLDQGKDTVQKVINLGEKKEATFTYGNKECTVSIIGTSEDMVTLAVRIIEGPEATVIAQPVLRVLWGELSHIEYEESQGSKLSLGVIAYKTLP
jgi:hypothetical protein